MAESRKEMKLPPRVIIEFRTDTDAFAESGSHSMVLMMEQLTNLAYMVRGRGIENFPLLDAAGELIGFASLSFPPQEPDDANDPRT